MYETRSLTSRTETRDELKIIPEQTLESEEAAGSARNNVASAVLRHSKFGACEGLRGVALEAFLWGASGTGLQPFIVLCLYYAGELHRQLIKTNVCLEYQLHSFTETDILGHSQPKSPSLTGNLSTWIFHFNPNNLNNGLNYSLPLSQRQTECEKSICD